MKLLKDIMNKNNKNIIIFTTTMPNTIITITIISLAYDFGVNESNNNNAKDPTNKGIIQWK